MKSRAAIFASVAGALGAILSVMCNDPGDQSDCATFCDRAETCLLLPSPLGARTEDVSARENCEARCSLSEPDRRALVTRCFQDTSQGVDLSPTGDVDKDWCLQGGACQSAAKCLQLAFPNESILGHSTLDVVPIVDVPDSPANETCQETCSKETCATPLAEQLTCDARICSTAKLFDNTSAEAWCAAVQATAAIIRVESVGAVISSTPMSCPKALSQSFSADELVPGPARAVLKIRGTKSEPQANTGGGGAGGGPDSNPIATPFCWIFYSPKTVIGAAHEDRVVIALPGGITETCSGEACEDSEERCTDGLDNDSDGVSDCADIDCLPFCAHPCEEDVDACSDGVDNDGDGISDCADIDCSPLCNEASPSCVEDGGCDDGGAEAGTN